MLLKSLYTKSTISEGKINFFKGFLYRPGDVGTSEFFQKYGMSFFSWEYFFLVILSISTVSIFLFFLYKKKWNIYISK